MLDLTLLCAFAYCAGMIDAAVGGGGLIQIPALINLLPGTPDATVFGTNKFSSVWGTSLSARSYAGKVNIQWKLVLPAAATAFVMSFFGAATVSQIPPGLLRPMALWLVVIMAIYIFRKKDFGAISRPLQVGRRERILSILIGGVIGFYDGLFGPGTGSFLIFLFIHYLALDFLQATASAKFVNLATNLAALMYFVPSGNVLFAVAIPMAACNMLGAYTGTQIAMKRGTRFIRGLFLMLLVVMIVKLAYDMMMGA